MAQRHLKRTSLTTSGATLARFLFSAPLIVVAVVTLTVVMNQEVPTLTARFWAFALSGGVGQILATMCVVALFAERNFAVGITFKKSEVLLTAVAGFLVLGDAVSPLGALALVLGFVAVLILSDAPNTAVAPSLSRVFNRAVALGIASGAFFAISAVGYRGAILELGEAPLAFRAGLTLAIVTVFQTAVMMLWMRKQVPGEITAVLRNWRVAGLVGLFSMLGSYGWFAAFGLQSAAYVFALGQVELIFSILAAVLVFGERITRRELIGMGLLTASIVALVSLG